MRSEHDMLKKEHIDPERTHLNRAYIERDVEDVYKESFQDAWDKWSGDFAERVKSRYASYFDKVRTEDERASKRKEEGKTYAARQSSRVAHVQKSCWLQIGDKDNHPSDRECYEYAERMLEVIKEKYPQLATVSYHLHMDEETPHIHWNYVCVAKGGERGMELRNAEGRCYEQMGFAVTDEDKRRGYLEHKFPTSQTKFQDSLRAELTGIALDMGYEIKHSDHAKTQIAHRVFKEKQDLRRIQELAERMERAGITRAEYESLEMMKGLSNERAVLQAFDGDVERANEFIENMNAVLDAARAIEFTEEREREVAEHRKKVEEYFEGKNGAR